MGKTMSSVKVKAGSAACLSARAGDRDTGRERAPSSELILRLWVWDPK